MTKPDLPTPPPPVEPVVIAPATPVRSFALTALLVLAIFYTVYLMRSFLLPIVVALLFAYLLAPFVRILSRWKIPPLIGAAMIIAGVLGIFGLGLAQLVEPAAGWMEKAPYSMRLVKEKIRPLQQPIAKVKEASEQIAEITEPAPTGIPKVVTVKKRSIGDFVITQTPAFLAAVVVTVILVYFMLAYSELLLSKVVKIVPRFEDKKHAVGIAREVEQSISKYLVTVLLINSCLGLVVGVAVYVLGMPNPILWGVVAAVLNFIPYLGAIIGVTAMGLAALLSFDSLGWAMVFPATYLLINSIEGNFITPMILGRSFTLNPFVIVIGLLFWGWIWGIVGMLLAVPILVTFKIFCEHIKPLESIGEFLSD